MRLDPHREDRRARIRHLLRAGVLAIAGLAIVPLPVAAADGDPAEPPVTEPAGGEQPGTEPGTEPSPGTEPTPGTDPTPPPAPIIRKVLVYRPSTVVRQYKKTWCVAAATQTMWNILKQKTNRTYARQKKLYADIRKHNRYRYKTHGNDIAGWAWALRNRTGFQYKARSYASKTTALNEIANALDRTGHPVGITVWRGTHAWIVMGYRASVDPDDRAKRTILGYYVSGPLGPESKDPWKYEYMPMAAFKKVYSKYHEWQKKVVWEGRYVLVSDRPRP